MSDLRRQLQQARDAYRAQRYPGNLAADVLPRRRINPFSLWTGAGIGAIAAALVLAVWLYRPTTTIDESGENGGIATKTNEAESEAEKELRIVPPYFSLQVPAVPSFPSWEAMSGASEETETTTRESV